MPKKYTRKKPPMRKRRTSKTKSGRIAKSMQNKSLSYVRKKYTVVIPIDVPAGLNVAVATMSRIGGNNAASPISTLTL